MSDLFRAEALAARRAVSGPGRLLGRERTGRLWLLLLVLLAVSVVAALVVQVPSYAIPRGAGRSAHHHVVRTGEEPLLLFLWRAAT